MNAAGGEIRFSLAFPPVKWLGPIVFVALSLSLTAQIKSARWSPGFSLDKKETSVEIIGSSDDGLIAVTPLSGRTDGFVIKRFHKDSLTLLSSVEVNLEHDDLQKQEIEEVFVLKGLIIVLSSIKNKGTEGRLLMLSSFSAKGESRVSGKLLCTMPESRFRNKMRFGYCFSSDESMCLFYRQIEDKSEKNLTYELTILDAEFEKVNEKKLTLPYLSEMIEITDWIIDSRGNIWFLTGVKPEKRINDFRTEFQALERHILFTYDNELNRLKEFDVSLKDRWVMALTMIELEDNNIGVGGFFSNDPAFSIAGTFFLRFDTESKSLLSTGLMPFDKEFIREHNRNGTFSKELEDYYLDYLLPADEGGLWYVAEQFYMTENYVIDGTVGRQNVTFTYHYNDILVVKVDSAGVIKHSSRIPKKQYSINDGGKPLSYAVSFANESLHLLFYDHADNLSLDIKSEPRSMSNIRKARLNMVNIGKDGLMNREVLPSTEKKHFVLPKKLYIDGGGSFYGISTAGKQSRILKIDL